MEGCLMPKNKSLLQKKKAKKKHSIGEQFYLRSMKFRYFNV